MNLINFIRWSHLKYQQYIKIITKNIAIIINLINLTIDKIKIKIIDKTTKTTTTHKIINIKPINNLTKISNTKTTIIIIIIITILKNLTINQNLKHLYVDQLNNLNNKKINLILNHIRINL